MPVGNELISAVDIFSKVVIFYGHLTCSLALFMYMHAVILQCLFCHVLAYAIIANGTCLYSLVPPLAH